jgi:hypothetical protein
MRWGGAGRPRGNSHAYGLLHAICATAVSGGLIVSVACTITGVMNTPSRQREVIPVTPTFPIGARNGYWLGRATLAPKTAALRSRSGGLDFDMP